VSARLRAQRHVEQEVGGPRRRWISTSVDPYSNTLNRVELLVLEGSPAVGFVLVAEGFALAISAGGRRVKRFRRSADRAVRP
jgi:hypothetical protein